MTTHVPVLVTLDLKVHADKRTSNTSVQNNPDAKRVFLHFPLQSQVYVPSEI